MAIAVLAAGRAWNPVVEDWTAEPPSGWRGLDGPGFTLACPNRFVFHTARPGRGGAEMTLQPAGTAFTALRIFVYTAAAPQPTLRAFLARHLGVAAPQRERLIRLGPLHGQGESGTLASGRLWKAAALNARAEERASRPPPTFFSDGRARADSLSAPVTGLAAIYEQVPASDQDLFDRILGSIRLRYTGAR